MDNVDNMDNEPLYMISVVAEMLEVHPQTLRLYEREGLIKPQRTTGNTRLFSEADIERIRQILTLTRELGVNLAGVEIILNLKEQLKQLKSDVRELLMFLQQELEKEFSGFEEKYKQTLIKSPAGNIVQTVMRED